MPGTAIGQLIPVLQTAIGPVILVSGVGLLLLTMTNRLSRVVDISRTMARETRELPVAQREPILAQLRILSHRADLIRMAI